MKKIIIIYFLIITFSCRSKIKDGNSLEIKEEQTFIIFGTDTLIITSESGVDIDVTRVRHGMSGHSNPRLRVFVIRIFPDSLKNIGYYDE